MNDMKGYYAIINLLPAFLSCLLIVAIIKGENPRVSNTLYIFSGGANLIGYAGLWNVNKERIRSLRRKKKY